MDESHPRHWGEDPYWIDAMEHFYQLRDSGRPITLDLQAIEEAIFSPNSPALKLMDAMVQVREQEGMESFRGAPRLLLAAIAILEELSRSKGQP